MKEVLYGKTRKNLQAGQPLLLRYSPAACRNIVSCIAEVTENSVKSYLLPCIFHKLTGLYCPGCGGTRAVYWLLKGNVAYSLHYHSIVLYGAVLYVWYMLSNTMQYVSHGRISIGMKYRPVYGKIAVVLLVVNTIWKNGNLLLFHKGL